MSSNRYGQIWHGDHHHINIRFPSTEARLKFREEFEEYHNSHDHDGDIPIFKDVTTKDLKLGTGSRSPEDLMKAETDDTYRITIDGYHWSEIRSYQDNQDLSDYNWYRPPTCCVPPTIVIDSEYVSSADLKRHPLSAIFGNMPDSDFQSLLSSVESDGFIEPVIRIYEGQILDGWHRYRAAQELGIIRKLRFREWNEDSHRDGDPKVFVLARNIERRHLNAAQRAQIAVTFNERFGHGGDRTESKSPNGDLKTRQELAKEAGVGTSTIDRAVQIEKAGKSEEVISGEKSAGQVITEETVKDLWAKVSEEIPKWKAREKEKCQYPSDSIGNASKSMLIEALRQCDSDNDNEGSATAEELKELLNRMQADNFPFVVAVRDVLKNEQETEARSGEARSLLGSPSSAKQGETPPKPDRRGCKRELQRIYDFNGHLDNSKEEVVFFDLLKRHHNLDEGTIRALMAEVIEEGNRSDAEKYKDLYDAFEKRVPKWKAKYAESGYKENALIQAATEDDILSAYREHQNSNLTGELRPNELKHVTELMQRASYPFARTLRNMLREDKVSESEAEAPDTDADLEKACESLSEVVDDFILCFTDDEGYAMAEYDKLCDVAAVRFGCDRDTLYQLLYDQNVPEHFGTGDLITYHKIVHRMLEDVKSNADWVSKLQGDADDQESTGFPKTAEACNLTDEGLAGVDVRALNENVSSLLQSLDASEMDRHFKELLTADLNDVFLQYENPPTVKEMVIALLDTAHRTLSEVI